MDVLGTFTYSAEEFIENGNIFTIEFGFEQGDTKIVINYNVEKDGEKRTLIIKGAYERSSTAKVPLNHHNQILEKVNLNHMFEIAKEYMVTLTPRFVTEDYPESLKKVAEDRAKNSEKN